MLRINDPQKQARGLVKINKTSYNFHEYKTLCFCGPLIRSIQSCQINTIAYISKGKVFLIHTVER